MATNDPSNWLKLNILIDRACDVLRQLFLKAWKARFKNEWCVTKINIDMMLKQKKIRKLSQLQMNTILNGDVNSWDFITLRAILTSRGFLHVTEKEESNINSLVKIRNKLVHFASKGMTDSEFKIDWHTVTTILVEFGESEADLELLKQGSGIGGLEFTNKECIDAESTLKAQRLKVAGNEQFQLENWAESIKFYSQAIVLDGIPSADLATLHCNRSAAFLKKKEFNLAWEDAEKTIELWPEWWKGHYRQGLVYTEMEKYKVAEMCFDEAFAREQDLDEIKEARCYVQMKQVEMEGHDSMISRSANQSLDDIISRFNDLSVSQCYSDSITLSDHLLNWQICQIGHKYQTGSGGFRQNYKAAAGHYKNAVDRGSAEGLYSLALLTFEGKGVKRDMQLGIKMLEMAAGMNTLINGSENVGVAQSEHALGLFYEHGIGVTKDETVAEDWYKRASEHGSVMATNDLGLMYRKMGDVVKAGQCFEMAAAKGYMKATLNLVDHYSDQRDRFLHQLEPRQNAKYCKQFEKYAKTSSYASELQKAQNHSIAAQLAMDQLVDLEPLPMTLCKKFITELAACAKIDFTVAELREGVHQQACSLVDYLLTRKTTFHEDTCVCYAALNGLFSQEATVIFLNECVQRYPRNVFFVRMRGQLNCILESYEDGIRDITTSMCLDPSKYECLFDRAFMLMLYYPSVTAESTIAAYKEFLAVAPNDNRMIPTSYYGMAKMHYEIACATVKPSERNKNLSATKKNFDMGVKAEKKQLPFFLPYESKTKTQVEHLINTLKVFTEQKQSTSKQQQSGVPAKSKASVDSKPETVKKERVFRPAMSNPLREEMTKIHREAIAAFPAAIPSSRFDSNLSVYSKKVQQSARRLSGLKAITLREMDHRQGKVYKGRVLDVTIIDDMVIISCLIVIVEDSCGDVIQLTIDNWQCEKDMAQVKSKFGIGCKMSIINPHMVILPTDRKSVIRVEDTKSVVSTGFVEKMCRYCCEPNASKSCSKCMASYCDRECQILDWKRDHKLVCGKIP